MILLAKESSSYNEISVYEATQLYGELGKFRYLQFADGAVQGALDLKQPKRMVLEYPRAMAHLMEYNHSSFSSLFVIGHGIGTIAGRYPDKRVTVAEIDETVVQLSRRFFGYSGDNVVIGDGRQMLESVPPGSLDYIVLDAFTAKGTPMHLLSAECFAMTKEKLRAGGAILLNLMGKGGSDRLINAIYSTLAETYACTKAFVLQGEGSDKTEWHNVILIAGSRDMDYRLPDMAGFREMEPEQGYLIVDRKT
ncbi:spermidine synthase [Paenibacillus sp. H1-7]|uniref:spermidine synthase n=1 Tax=Paenibacillus sp. H1-7 TaxID=2282849 RepID=UPI001EF9178B|nr:fused MFS/spermidine synthase [Paenibacillus sp. H1-7]ULL13953.1 spermidine synthase [Paenibacillus sp. H1-7]